MKCYRYQTPQYVIKRENDNYEFCQNFGKSLISDAA
jgi:hypothetical protein